MTAGGETSTVWTVGALLRWTTSRFDAVGIHGARLDAERLLALALGCRRLDLYLRHDEVVAEEPRARFREVVRRRLAREPVAYIEGTRGFHSLDLDLRVDGRVLVPRPETELLVDRVLEQLIPAAECVAPLGLIDVGTGSGAIALALAKARPDARVVAVDISPGALEVARENIERLGLPVEVRKADLLIGVDAPPDGWDAIVANLPYIRADEVDTLAPEVREHEPRIALVGGGADGLAEIRALIEQAARPSMLSPIGVLALEVGAGQADVVAALVRGVGLDVAVARDYAGIARIVVGRRGGLRPVRGGQAPRPEPAGSEPADEPPMQASHEQRDEPEDDAVAMHGWGGGEVDDARRAK